MRQFFKKYGGPVVSTIGIIGLIVSWVVFDGRTFLGQKPKSTSLLGDLLFIGNALLAIIPMICELKNSGKH